MQMVRKADIRYIQFYTDGSAARKPEFAKTAKLNAVRRTVKKKRLTLFIDPVAIAGIAMAMIMLVLMLVGVSQLKQAQQQTAMMEQQMQMLSQEKQALEDSFNAGYKLEDVKWMADALGLVPVEEVTHITISAPEAEMVTPSRWQQFYTLLTSLFA